MILLVDDDKARAGPLCEMLRFQNHAYELVTKAREVPGFLRDRHLEITTVMLDILMSNHNVANILRAEFEYSHPHPNDETGLILFDYIQEKYPKLRIVIHSVVRQARIISRLTGDKVTIVPKPASLVELLEELVRDI